MRMYAAGRFNSELKVIGGMSSTWGNIRDLKKIKGEKFVITNSYHIPRLLLLDPSLKVISAELILGVPERISRIEIIKYYLTRWLNYLR